MTMMKKRIIALGALAAASALAVASAATASSQVPFSASLSGTVTDTPCGFLAICLTGTDQGTATHLGLVTLTKSATIQITFAACDDGGLLTTYAETGMLVAANGDTLSLSGGGTACVVNGHALASGVLMVTGGSGRFSGAGGTLAESIDHNLVTDTEAVSLSGTISSPGSA
jgi:type 1 fimbria pilin